MWKEMKKTYNIAVYKDEDGTFIAECIDLPGCVSDGKTRKACLENIKEAIEAYNESLAKHGELKNPERKELVRLTV